MNTETVLFGNASHFWCRWLRRRLRKKRLRRLRGRLYRMLRSRLVARSVGGKVGGKVGSSTGGSSRSSCVSTERNRSERLRAVKRWSNLFVTLVVNSANICCINCCTACFTACCIICSMFCVMLRCGGSGISSYSSRVGADILSFLESLMKASDRVGVSIFS